MDGYLVGLFAVTAIGVIGFTIYYNYKKTKAFREWVTRRGFSLESGRDHSADQRFPNLACMQQGRNRYGYDFVRGTWKDRQLEAFHYHYETTSRGSKGQTQTHHHYYTIVALLSEIPLRHLDMRPENVLDKFGTFFGFEDINFESAEFSRKYHVKAEERKWAYDVLHARCMEYLLQRPPIAMHFHGNWAVAYFSGIFEPERVEEAAETLSGVLGCLPGYVLREHGIQQTEVHG